MTLRTSRTAHLIPCCKARCLRHYDRSAHSDGNKKPRDGGAWFYSKKLVINVTLNSISQRFYVLASVVQIMRNFIAMSFGCS